MNIKMIVMDMDGTLLTHEQNIMSETKEALFEAQKRGVKLVLASGRSYRTLTKYGLELDMDKNKGKFICVNGAAITDVQTMHTEYIRQLVPEEIQEVFNYAKQFDVEIMAVQDSIIHDYIPKSVMELKKVYRKENNIAEDVPYTAGTFFLIVDQRKGYEEIHYINSAEELTARANKMVITHEPEVIAAIYDKLVDALGDKYTFVRTSPRWVEVSPKGISKGNAILTLAKENNIQSSEIMVFGDGENDLSMFEVVTYPVAMGNAMQTVKDKAFFVTKTNEDNGIGYAINKYVLNK